MDRFRPDVALVCTPPVHHVSASLQLVRAGADVFMEKPVAAALDGVDELIREADERQRIVQVGYNLRFHPVVAAAAGRLASGAIGRVLYAHAQESASTSRIGGRRLTTERAIRPARRWAAESFWTPRTRSTT